MRKNAKWLWSALFALALVLGGAAYTVQTSASAPGAAAGYCCPVTGECLPCPECCELN